MLCGYKEKPGKALALLMTLSFVGEADNHNSYLSVKDVNIYCNRETNRLREREFRKTLERS